jgi:type II secretory pathway pseudopilin PulG
MLEVLVTLVIVAILSGIAVTTYRFFTGESRARGAESSLVSVAAAADAYQLSRGFWPSAASLNAIGDGTITIVDTPSSGPSDVSIAEFDVDGTAVLGLAVRTDDDQCLTMRLLPPESPGAATVLRRDLAEADTCDGSSA